MGIEKRRHPRLDVDFTIEYSVESTFSDRLVNVSVGGALVQTDRPLWADTVLNLNFDLPGGGGTVRARAKVMWVVEASVDDKGDVTSGSMGLMFLKIEDADRARLDAYINRQLEIG